MLRKQNAERKIDALTFWLLPKGIVIFKTPLPRWVHGHPKSSGSFLNVPIQIQGAALLENQLWQQHQQIIGRKEKMSYCSGAILGVSRKFFCRQWGLSWSQLVISNLQLSKGNSNMVTLAYSLHMKSLAHNFHQLLISLNEFW